MMRLIIQAYFLSLSQSSLCLSSTLNTCSRFVAMKKSDSFEARFKLLVALPQQQQQQQQLSTLHIRRLIGRTGDEIDVHVLIRPVADVTDWTPALAGRC
jgi:hypothetical protein